MKPILKWAGIALGGFLAIILLAATVLSFMGGSRLNRRYDIPVAAIAIPSDEVAIARGRHLVEAVTFCQECHGENLEGSILEDIPLIATISAPNLTSGRGGVVATYSDADYVRAIRHGVNPAGRGLMIMHSDIFHNLSEGDLGATIAYVKSVPPADNELPPTQPKVLGKILVALGQFDSEALPLIPAERIDHTASFTVMPPPGVTVDYGRYLMSITLCAMCHGADLQGGPPIDPASPPGPNIAVYGTPGGWSAEQFTSTIRTGVRPDGSRSLNPDWMPWNVYANLTDEELQAIWLYIQSLNGMSQ